MFHILIAEDNPADLYFLQQALAANQVPCTTHVVRNAAEFLDYARDKCSGGKEEAKPDLILLDWSLPRGTGPQLIKAIRETDRCMHSVILVLTSSVSPDDRTAAISAGADEFISKPSDLDQFLDIGGVILDRLQKRSQVFPKR